MAQMGRPKKNEEDLVKNQLIAIDKSDYRKIKIKSIETNEPIKVVIKRLVESL